MPLWKWNRKSPPSLGWPNLGHCTKWWNGTHTESWNWWKGQWRWSAPFCLCIKTARLPGLHYQIPGSLASRNGGQWSNVSQGGTRACFCLWLDAILYAYVKEKEGRAKTYVNSAKSPAQNGFQRAQSREEKLSMPAVSIKEWGEYFLSVRVSITFFAYDSIYISCWVEHENVWTISGQASKYLTHIHIWHRKVDMHMHACIHVCAHDFT